MVRERAIRRAELLFEIAGRLSEVRVFGTVTGRLSSWKPNIQEIPRIRLLGKPVSFYEHRHYQKTSSQ